MSRPILIVDDTEQNRYVLAKILKKAGYETLELSSGNEVLEQAKSLPLLIILDVGLPDINGYEVTRRLKSDPATNSVPILQMSARFTLGNSVSERIESLADGYLSQPFEPEVLLATVKSLVRMQAYKQELEEAIRVRDHFLSIASHELKTPLTSFKLQNQTRLKKLKKGDTSMSEPGALTKLFETDERQITRLTQLVDAMLDISRINGGRLVLQLEESDLAELINEIVERFRARFEQAGQLITVELPEKLTGRWDLIRLDQVLTNLIINAINYGEHKPVHVRAEQIGDQVRVAISDSGIGIAEESHARVFNRFERAVSENQVSGLGLGLFIAQEIVSLHGGEIDLQSRLGSGSTFTVTLPRFTQLS